MLAQTFRHFAICQWLFLTLLLVIWFVVLPRPGQTISASIPLIDMGSATYFGFSGGLYPNASNMPPAEHTNEGTGRANLIQPIDKYGNPDPAGAIIFLSIGMSNTFLEFCGQSYWPCTPESFGGQAFADPQVNYTSLILLNGARPGQSVTEWQSPRSLNYQIISQKLNEAGFSEAQIQVIWLKVVNDDSATRPSLPAPDADAYLLLGQLADVVRTIKLNYPNLQQVFLSSRIYGGYSTLPTSPEPYAYETGFSVKWLIEAQIEQMASGEINPQTGDLNYNSLAPWLAWGDYLWANGSQPRSDGLTWQPADFESDGLHPSPAGVQKVGQLLLDFFKHSPFTLPWFITTVPPTPTSIPITPTPTAIVTTPTPRFTSTPPTAATATTPAPRPTRAP